MSSIPPIFTWGDWTFEPAEWRLARAAVLVPLPNKTLELLALLLERAPSLVSKDDILATVWRDAAVEEGNIAFHVAMLRKTLDTPAASSSIETVRGRGYRFVAPLTRRVELEPSASVRPAPAVPPLTDSGDVPTSVVRTSPAQPPDPVQGTPDRRSIVRLWPAALVALGVGGLAWGSLVNVDARVREVVVLSARSPDTTVIEGIAATAAASLARDTTLRSRTAAWASPNETAIEAGRRVQAETVLTSLVDQSQDPWRIAVQLVRIRDGVPLWSWMFDVPASLPAPGAVIAARVTEGLGRHLGVAEPPRTAVNAEALTLTLRGREAWRLRTAPSVQQAISFYERAIDIDPAFAPAYAGLADCYNLTMSGLPVPVRAENAKANAEHAVALDPGLAAAHTSRAFSLYKFDWNWSEAEAAFRRAIAIDPSYALAHHWYGEMLAYIGRFDEAIAEMRRAQALDPTSVPIIIDLAGPLLHSGRVAEARAVVEAGSAVNPMFHGVPGRMAEVLFAEGRERESLEEAWRAQILRGASLESVEELRAAYRIGGLPAVLRIEIARLEADGTERFAVPAQATFLAGKYARLGDRTKALEWIRIGIDRREDIALHLRTYPEYDWLRDDPEFNRQLARLGLPAK